MSILTICEIKHKMASSGCKYICINFLYFKTLIILKHCIICYSSHKCPVILKISIIIIVLIYINTYLNNLKNSNNIYIDSLKKLWQFLVLLHNMYEVGDIRKIQKLTYTKFIWIIAQGFFWKTLTYIQN